MQILKARPQSRAFSLSADVAERSTKYEERRERSSSCRNDIFYRDEGDEMDRSKPGVRALSQRVKPTL
jgi:hypothetical protein